MRSKEGRLAVRSVEPVWDDDDTIYVKGDLQEGEAVVVSRLQAAVPGMALSLSGGPPTEKVADRVPPKTEQAAPPKKRVSTP